MAGRPGNVVDVDRAAFVDLGRTARNHQRHAQRVRGGEGDGDALRLHRQHKIRRGGIVFRRHDFAHAGDDFGRGENVAVIEEAAGQNTPFFAQLLAEVADELARFGTANLRAIANTARRACDRFQLAQPEVRHNVAQDINILAHGRFGRPEEVAKIGKREDAVRLGGKNLHHSAHALVAADFVHGGIAPLSVVECESRCT